MLVESGGKADAFRYEPNFYELYIQDTPIAVGEDLAAYGPLLACSFGLLQVMAMVAYERGFAGRPEELFQPEIGLEWGCKQLRWLLNWANGNEIQALAGFNGGKGGNFQAPYRNQAYVSRVYAERDRLAVAGGGFSV